MTNDFRIWRRHETRPLVKAYNNFAVVLMAVAFAVTFFFLLSQSSPVVDFAPIFAAVALLTFVYLKDVSPELRRSSQTLDGLRGMLGRRTDLHSRMVAALFLSIWLAWFLSFVAFLDANTTMWGMWASTTAMRGVITSSEPMLWLSVLFLSSAMVVTAYAEWRKPDFPLYSLEGLWQSSLDFSWFERFWWYSVAAEVILFAVGLYENISGCLAPCTTSGWGVVLLLSSLMLPLEIAVVDVAVCSVLLLRSRMKKYRVPTTFYVATTVWLLVGILALYAFWAVVSNPLP